MRRSVMRPDALLHCGAASRFRVAIGLAVAASAGVMLWGGGTQSVLATESGRNAARENRGSTRYPVVAYLSVSASEFDRNVAGETPMTLEDTVAALSAELAQVKAETAKLLKAAEDQKKRLEAQLGSPMIETLKGTDGLN